MMRILLTGASSFTGTWFATALAEADHDVTCTFQRSDCTAYDDDPGRSARVRRVIERTSPSWSCSFGDDTFMTLLNDHGPWDVVCHHAADVTNYKSAEFDVARAVTNNTMNIQTVLATLKSNGCSKLVLTDSVFAPNEGAGSDGLPAFSPYGLSKGITTNIFSYYAAQFGMSIGQFVIPNPFGPFEEPRFTNYLMKMWYAGETPCIQTPDYVRDNIHVSLLALAYVRFVENLSATPGRSSLHPAGYIESQGAFARRFAENMESRLDIECPVECANQTEFPEPRIRINTDAINAAELSWNESEAWDAIAAFYSEQYAACTNA